MSGSKGSMARADVLPFLFLFLFGTKMQGLKTICLLYPDYLYLFVLIYTYQVCTKRSASSFPVMKYLIWLY